MRILIPKVEEIIQIANTPIMAGLRNSRIAFKLFEAKVIPALLNNCAPWINKLQLTDLQEFQDNFVRKILLVPKYIKKHRKSMIFSCGQWNRELKREN